MANAEGDQALEFGKNNTVEETRAEKKAHELREPEELMKEEQAREEEEEEARKAEEELRKKEQEVTDLECQLEAAYKRVQEHRAEVAQKGARQHLAIKTRIR